MTDEPKKDENGNQLDDWLRGLSDAQLAGVSAQVGAHVEKRSSPKYGQLSDTELRAECEKKFNFSPI